VAALIERHAAQLRQRISALEAMRRDLERMAKNARASTSGDAPEAAFCHIIEAERTRVLEKDSGQS
jgi:hypothetical protein